MTDFTKLSDITRFTVQAVEEAEAHPDCVVDMIEFHDYDGEFCIACAAGYAAIKRWEGSVKPVRASSISDFAESVGVDRCEAQKFEWAVDYLRIGRPAIAAKCLGIDPPSEKFRHIPGYHGAREEWKKSMLKMAEDLEAEGL